ncbi:MAG: (Fe-S)-binding protein [Acidobacteriota bacterium]|nr:(Fe-S)-binding protein [Acidobacteriota bacterium]
MNKQSAMNAYIKEIGGWVAGQLEACTRCGLCASACHFYQVTDDPEYAPVWKVSLLGQAYQQRFTFLGRLRQALGLGRPITDEALEKWSKLVFEGCTVCNKCAMVCPMGIQLGPLIHDVRAGLTAAGLVPADLHAATVKQDAIGSPLGVTDDAWQERIDWIAEEWEVDIPKDKKGVDTLVVFSSIEIMKFPENLVAVAKIMAKASESWTVSSKGREVVNFAFFEGDRELTKKFLNRVFGAARELGVKRIMISECGHAYDAFRWTAGNIMEVPKGIEVTHVVRVVYDFWKAGRIRLKKGAYDDGTITFHDSCKIQRRGGHIKEPRELLAWLAPRAFKEMSPAREQSLCCGGGGGVISIKEADALRLAVFGMKVEQMNKIGAQAVCMVCSNCRLQFTEGVAHYKSGIQVRGLTDMVFKAME